MMEKIKYFIHLNLIYRSLKMSNNIIKILTRFINFFLLPLLVFIIIYSWGKIRFELISLDFIGQIISSAENDKFIGGYSLFLLVFVFLGIWIPFNFQNVRLINFTNYIPSLLPALGLVGTFLGIFRGLGDFDPGNIDKSLPILLEGLKLAFSTSIIGMVGSAVVKLISFIQPEITNRDEISENDFFKQFQEQNSTLKDMKIGIDQLGNKMDEFTSSLGESTVEQLIKAIETVIKDFNNKIEEQFGENFKQFNKGLEKLLEWQSKYIDEIEKTKRAIDISNQLILSHEKTVAEVYNKLDLIPSTLKPLEETLSVINLEKESTQATLETLANLRFEAEQSIPVLENQLKQVSKTLSDEITQVSSKIVKLDQDMTNELEKAIEMMGAHLGSLSEQLVKDYQPLVTNLRNLIELSQKVKK